MKEKSKAGNEAATVSARAWPTAAPNNGPVTRASTDVARTMNAEACQEQGPAPAHAPATGFQSSVARVGELPKRMQGQGPCAAPPIFAADGTAKHSLAGGCRARRGTGTVALQALGTAPTHTRGAKQSLDASSEKHTGARRAAR